MVKSCWICKTNSNGKSYFRLPKETGNRSNEVNELSIERRSKWCQVLNIPFNVTKEIRICSVHFISGSPSRLLDTTDPDWIPTLNLKNFKKRFQQNVQCSSLKTTKSDVDHRNLMLMCRLCGEMKDDYVPLYPREDEDESQSLRNSIRDFLYLSVSIDDNLPKQVCCDCVKNLKMSQAWMAKVHEVNKQLSKLHNVRQTENIHNNDATDEANVSVETPHTKNENNSKRTYNKPSRIKLSKHEQLSKKCGICFQKFTNLDELMLHKSFCCVFWCTNCRPRRMFLSKHEYNKHKVSHDTKQVCQVCGKEYSQSYFLKHFRNHFSHLRKCSECGKLVKNLNRHRSDMHEVRTSRICEVCGGSYKNLEEHLHSHEDGSKTA